MSAMGICVYSQLVSTSEATKEEAWEVVGAFVKKGVRDIESLSRTSCKCNHGCESFQSVCNIKNPLTHILDIMELLHQ
jgi:hypothetical protein